MTEEQQNYNRINGELSSHFEKQIAIKYVLDIRMLPPSFPEIHDDKLREKLLWLLGDIADKCDLVMDQIRNGEV